MHESAPSAPRPSELPPSHGAAPNPRALAVGGVVLALGLYIAVGSTVQFLNPGFGIWFTELFIFLALGWVLLRRSGWRPAVFTGLSHVPRWGTLFGLLLGVANFFALVVPIQFLAQQLAPRWLTEMFDATRLFEGQRPVELALILTGATVAAPLCEEFFFRGVFQKGLTPAAPASPVKALVVASVVFSAFHLDPVGFVARVELGLLFGWLYLRTGSLWPSIAAHAANNGVSSVLYLLAKALGQEAGDSSDVDPRAVVGLAGLGWVGVLGLLTAARHFPAVWGRGAAAPEAEARTPGQTPALAQLLLPWVVAATVSLGLLAALDSRGVSLNFHDAQHPLPTLDKDAPPGLQAEREALKSLRAAARRGEIPMEAYHEERARQIQAHRQALGPANP